MTRARGKTRRYNPEETRRRVLEAAYKLFRDRGYSHSSTADIARLAEVAEGSIFYHFGSKQSLLAELSRSYGARLVDDMRGAGTDGLASLARALDRCFDYCDVNAGWEVSPNSRDRSGMPFFPAMRPLMVEWATEWLSQQENRLSGPPVDVAASLLVAVLEDAVCQYMDSGAMADKQRIRAECTRFSTAAVRGPA